MGAISVKGRNGKFSQSVVEMIVRFTGEVFPKLAEWERHLKVDPQTLDTLEREVQQEFLRGAGCDGRTRCHASASPGDCQRHESHLCER